MNDAFAAADRFLLGHARLLERRLFAACFLGQPAASVVAALRGYQNADGGFGHALEPDKRCPASLPVDVEVALQALATARASGAAGAGADAGAGAGAEAGAGAGAEAGAAGADAASAGAAEREMMLRACDFLARTAELSDAGGGVPPAFPVIESFPRAAHWSEWTYQPGLNPTAGLVGLLYRLGIDHPWRAVGEAYCWRQLESGEPVGDAHAVKETLTFLEYVPDTARADKHAAAIAASLPGLPMFRLDPEAEGYGLTPLDYAPLATSRWRSLFTDAQIEAHLDSLQHAQQADGGWPISWEPPDGAATSEWRGIVTLQALRTLTSYRRLAAST